MVAQPGASSQPALEKRVAKFSLNKSIEARKLNKRTGAPTTDPEVTIPYGALVDNIERHGDMSRFSYLGEPYSCPQDILASALGGALAADAPAGPAPPKASGPSGPERARLQWEVLESSHHSLMRSKVPGGWLVALGNTGLAFYTDPEHQWDGASPAPSQS